MIVINYGVPKSASTYMSTLCNALINKYSKKLGYRVYTLPDIFKESPYRSYYSYNTLHLRQNDFYKIINDTVPHNDFIQIKVHHKCSDYIINLLDSRKAVATANYRHPADCLLSLMDSYKKKPTKFSNAYSFDSALNAVKNNSEIFSTWSSSSVFYVYFDSFVLNPYKYLSEFAKIIGINKNTDTIVDEYEFNKSKIGQFNKGILNRRLNELSNSQIAMIEEACPYLVDFISKNH